MKKMFNLFGSFVLLFVSLFTMTSAASSTPTVTVVGVTGNPTVGIGNNVYISNLASSTASSCQPIITNYHKIGMQGVEVSKLQTFLNQVNGANLNGKGYFGLATQQEVKNFQFTYGIKPTGYQHILTTKMINDIYCGKVAKKARKVFVATTVVKTLAKTPTSMVTPSNTNIAPVGGSKNLVKEYELPKKEKLVSTTSNTNLVATKTSFWENIQKDWNKVKENYKAYLLVFALVLALFWFLRKAATE